MKKMRLVLAGILTAFCLTACGGQATSEEIIEMPEAAEQEETEAAAQDETETAAPEEEEAAASGETAETPAEQCCSGRSANGIRRRFSVGGLFGGCSASVR